MVSYKISDLTQTPEVDDNDYVPVVVDDGGTPVTNRATFETIKEYITGSVVSSLTASVLSGSSIYSTTLTSSYVTGNDAKFTSISGNLEWSYIQSTPTTTDDYGITDAVTIDDEQIISGRKTFDTHYVTASITGSDAKFTSLSGNLDWSYIVNEPSFLTSNQTITLSGDATGSGTTTISITNVSASFIKAGTDGSGLTSLTASQMNNFSSDVREQFVAGDNIIINDGAISASLSSIIGDVSIDGSLVANIKVSGSISSPIQATSYVLSSDDAGKTLLLSSSVTQAITCSSGLSTGFNCTFIQMGSGQLVLSGASGVTLLNRQNHTGSAGQYGAISVVSIDSDTFIIAGDTI